MQMILEYSLKISEYERQLSKIRTRQSKTPIDLELSPQPGGSSVLKSHFSDEHWKELTSVPFERRNDSTFLRKLLNILYDADPVNILYRSLNGCRSGKICMSDGKTYYRGAKKPISPEKRQLIRETFLDRIKNIPDITEAEKNLRKSERYINDSIALAINTLQRAIQKDQVDVPVVDEEL